MVVLANSYQQGIAQDMQVMMIMVGLIIISVLATLCYAFLFEPIISSSQAEENKSDNKATDKFVHYVDDEPLSQVKTVIAINNKLDDK